MNDALKTAIVPTMTVAKEHTCIYIEVDAEIYSGCADRFIVDKRLVKEIFVDEKLSLG